MEIQVHLMRRTFGFVEKFEFIEFTKIMKI